MASTVTRGWQTDFYLHRACCLVASADLWPPPLAVMHFLRVTASATRGSAGRGASARKREITRSSFRASSGRSGQTRSAGVWVRSRLAPPGVSNISHMDTLDADWLKYDLTEKMGSAPNNVWQGSVPLHLVRMHCWRTTPIRRETSSEFTNESVRSLN